MEWRGRIGTEDGSRCLLALGDVYAELDDFEEVRGPNRLVRDSFFFPP